MSVVSTRQTDLVRYLPTNSTAASYVVSEGLFALSTVNALAVPIIPMNGYRGLPEVSFFGTGADNATFVYTIYTVERVTQTNNAGSPQGVSALDPLMEVRNLLSGTATLSTMVGPSASGIVITSGERVADNVGTLSISGWGGQVQAMYGTTISSLSPANNTRALITIPDIGSVYGIIIDLQKATATAMNALYRLTT